MTDVACGPLGDGDRAAAIALLDAVQGVRTSQAEFAWWFEGSPAGRAKLLAAKLAGEVVGVYAMLPSRMRLGGREQVVWFPQKLVVDERTRGRGLFPRMQRLFEAQLREEGTPLFLGFPNAKAHPIWVGKLGALDLPPHRLWLRLARPSKALSRTRLPSRIARLFDVPFRALAGRKAPVATPSGGVTFQAIDRAGEAVDALWRAVSPSLPREVAQPVRSAAHLNWRYLDAPSGRYRATAAHEKGALSGYVVTGEIEKWGMRLGYVADLFAATRRGRAQLLDRALDELYARDVDAVAMLAETPSDRLLAARRGFVPTPRRFPVIGKVLDGDAASIAALQKPDGLAFSLGDLDFF